MKYHNSFLENHPDISKEWHLTKNENLYPQNVSKCSGKKVWWRCKAGHEWQALISSRHQGTGCPYCSGRKATAINCLAVTHPKIAAQWHYIKNGNLTPKDVKSGTNKKVWWICNISKDHEWQAVINDRCNNHGCPCCSGRKAVKSNSLSVTHPELSKEWHPTKNKDLTPDMIGRGSQKKIWWKCTVANDHEWEDSVDHRTSSKRNCPCCAGKKVVMSNCLAIKNPELAKQWHKTKNILTPYQVTPGSIKKVYWICNKSHEWIANINSRTNGNGCPKCRMSHGEKKISQILTSLKIKYIQWYKFKSCKHINLLPFDFVIFYKK